jgi:hypothetical protein
MLVGMATVQAGAFRHVQSPPPEHHEGPQMGSADASSFAPAAASAGGRLIHRVRTVSTPTALWLALCSLVIAMLAFGAVGVRIVTERRAAVDTVRSEGAPLVAATEALYVALADADAAASTAFLQAGLEPQVLRQRYQADIAQAGGELALIGRSTALPDDARDALTTLNEQLPVYTAYIESARTNNRLGYPVGAAYQRRASDVMQQLLLPAATNLYEQSARHLDRGHQAGSQRDVEVAVLIAGVVVVAMLAGVHLFLTARTRRLLNLGLIGAAVIVVATCTWTSVGLRAQRDALTRSQREGSDPLLVLSSARILALRSMSDENLDLIERGTNKADMDDFDAVSASIAGSDEQPGLLDRAANGAADAETEARIAELDSLHAQFLAAHDRVRDLAADDYNTAIAAAVTDQARASATLDAAFAQEIEISRGSLAERADDAADELRLSPYLIFLASLVGAVAVAAGMWPRIREYR